MKLWAESIFLAWRDWKYEYLLSFCAVLALASMLAPLLVLQGLKNGVTSGMRDRLLRDPATLVITPKSDAGRFDQQFIASLAALPGAAYAVGRTRETATDITMENPQTGSRASIALEPATPGEPVLTRYHLTAPQNTHDPQIILSATAAKNLQVKTNEILKAKLARRSPEGRLESVDLDFQVAGILPLAAGDRKFAFAPLSLLEQMEDYRDNLAVPERGFSGAAPLKERSYASFRLYAKELNAVETLASHLEGLHIEVITRAREIAAIRSLEAAINQVILIISLAVGLGFAAFTFSSSEGAIRRKQRMLGLLRLLGFTRSALFCYPATQTLLTALCGSALSLLIYWGVAKAIGQAFAQRGSLSCQLAVADALCAISAVCVISLISSIRGAWQAAALEPSLVVREA